MRKGRTDRKGISPLIAAVLLLAITMAVGSFAAPWFMDLTKTQTESETAAKDKIVKTTNANIDIKEYSYNKSNGNYTVTVENNGEETLENITLTVYGEIPTQKRLETTMVPGEIKIMDIQTPTNIEKTRIAVEPDNLDVMDDRNLD